MAKEILFYGNASCPFCQSLKAFLAANDIAYTYKDTDEPGVLDEMLVHSKGADMVPTLVIGGKVLQNPSHNLVAKTLQLTTLKDVARHDVVVVGAGPASLAAAIYTTREDIETVIIEKGVIGGLAAITDWVDNYPGFSKGISGLDLAGELQAQAERFGAAITYGEVTNIVDEGSCKYIETTEGDMRAKAVLIATGSAYKKLGIPGEEEYYGRGVHYCATCDGAFYRDKKLVVVGGGNSAVQEALFLTRFTTRIDLLVRSELRASEVLLHELDKAVQSVKITVHLQTVTEEIVSEDGKMVGKVRAKKDGKAIEFVTDGVFVFIGLKPNTGFLRHTDITLDEFGFVLTDSSQQTSVPGVFCAGDVRSGATMQIASAVGEGAMAALKIREYLERQERQQIAPAAEKPNR